MKAVLQWVLRTMMKDQTGIVQTMPKKDIVDFNVAMTMERLMRNGIDPNSLKNANQVENAINQIEAPRNVQQGIKSTKSAKVFDLEGKEIDPKKGIMGGKQAVENKTMLDDAIDDASPGFSGDRKVDAELVAENLAERMGKVYDDLSTKERLDLYDQAYTGLSKQRFKNMKKPIAEGLSDKEFKSEKTSFRLNIAKNSPEFNQDLAKKIINREIYTDLSDSQRKQFLDDLDFVLKNPRDGNAQGGRAGFSNGGIDVLKLEDEALQRAINAFKYYQSMGGKKNFRDYIKESGRFGDQFRAEGGRIGYKIGSIDKARRAFLKTVGAAGAGITALKTGLLGLGKEAAPIVDKAVETVTEAPSYFFDLVAKIKLLGEPRRTPSYKERVNEYQYTGKDGIEYELIEDLDTGEIIIQKDKIGGRSFEEGSYDVIEDRTEMRYKKPKPDEGDPNPAEEYEEYKVEFDQDGTAADVSQIDEISKKEIIKEVTEDAPSIKKASGGIARMLGE